MRLLSIILHIVAGLAFGAPTAPDKTPIVFVETLKGEKLYDVLTYPARLSPKINAAILAETGGVVRRIHVPLGGRVRRGEPVATVANTDPVYQYAAVKIVSSVTGIVSSVDVTEGTQVEKGQRLMTITDPKRIKISVEIAAADLGLVKTRLKGELRLYTQERSFPVEVLGVSPFVDPATGTATAELSTIGSPPEFALVPGLVGRVTFRVAEHEGISIPDSALFYSGKEPSVRLVEDGKAKWTSVKLGRTRSGRVEILSGLEAGSVVIVRASTFVGDGDTVKVEGTLGAS